MSIRNAISGLGGIAGVDTVFGIVFDSPGARFSVTSAGVTPGAADAVPTPATSIAPATTAHTAARKLRVILTVSFLLVRRYALTNLKSLAIQNFHDCATRDAPSSRVGACGYEIALG
ncbi:hypothetical protein [Microbispora sp. KK1-11]|uniref:hypothetical protein n=1 Tax=Microbispora sp. KK1-11 TaxID=2053005 RepID=UPI00163C9DFA|nr:hypothetical protein [Microbispora sp. KK1-11]